MAINNGQNTPIMQFFIDDENMRVSNRISNFTTKTPETQIKKIYEKIYDGNRFLSSWSKGGVFYNRFSGRPMTRYNKTTRRMMSVSLHINKNGTSYVNFWHAKVLKNNPLFKADMEIISLKFGGKLSINQDAGVFKFSSIEDGIDFIKKATDEYKLMGG
jgi:hypothetical protein|tara:strand:- start:414 stop:890 length:477 start_codon:yes stop_codon:yes gene_type:complete